MCIFIPYVCIILIMRILRYSEYMSKKQEVFSLPIIFKNESKNEDCLDIMDAYERQLTEIFTLAHGILKTQFYNCLRMLQNLIVYALYFKKSFFKILSK